MLVISIEYHLIYYSSFIGSKVKKEAKERKGWRQSGKRRKETGQKSENGWQRNLGLG